MTPNDMERPHVVFDPRTWAIVALFYAAIIAGILAVVGL